MGKIILKNYNKSPLWKFQLNIKCLLVEKTGKKLPDVYKWQRVPTASLAAAFTKRHHGRLNRQKSPIFWGLILFDIIYNQLGHFRRNNFAGQMLTIPLPSLIDFRIEITNRIFGSYYQSMTWPFTRCVRN